MRPRSRKASYPTFITVEPNSSEELKQVRAFQQPGKPWVRPQGIE